MRRNKDKREVVTRRITPGESSAGTIVVLDTVTFEDGRVGFCDGATITTIGGQSVKLSPGEARNLYELLAEVLGE